MPGIRYEVEADWDGNGMFDNSHSRLGEAGHVMNIQSNRGESNMREIAAPGTATVRVLNDSGLYSLQGQGALAGKILPGRAIRITSTILDAADQPVGAPIPVYYGYMSNATEQSDSGLAPTIALNCLDAIDLFQLGDISLPLLKNQRADQLLNIILDTTGWPEALRRIQEASPKAGLVERFTGEKRTPSSLLREAAKSDPGGHLWIAPDGYVSFSNSRARHLADQIGILDDSQYTQSLNTSINRKDLRDTVNHESSGLTGASRTAVYVDTTFRRLLPGDTVIEDSYIYESDNVSAPRPVQDYTANTSAFGDGVDKTLLVSVSSFEARGAGFTVVFQNISRDTLYLRGPGIVDGFKIEGDPLQRQGGENIAQRKKTPVVPTDQIWADQWSFFSDTEQLGRFARFRSEVFARQQLRVTARLVHGEDDAGLFPRWILAADLGDKVGLRNVDGLNPARIAKANGDPVDMVVSQIHLSATPPIGHTKITWVLLSEDLALASGGKIGRDGLSTDKTGTW